MSLFDRVFPARKWMAYSAWLEDRCFTLRKVDIASHDLGPDARARALREEADVQQYMRHFFGVGKMKL